MIFSINLHNQPRKWRMYASTDKVNWTVVADEDNYNNHDWRDPLFEFYGGSRSHKRYNDLSGHLIDRPNPVKIPKHYTKDLSNGVLCRYFRMTVQDISGEYTGPGTKHQGTTHKVIGYREVLCYGVKVVKILIILVIIQRWEMMNYMV